MLKIRDDIDLKELEKYGIKPHYDCNEHTGRTYVKYLISNRYIGAHGSLRFYPKKKKGLLIINGIISNNNKDTSLYFFSDETYVDVDLLYDLIKANLVVKE